MSTINIFKDIEGYFKLEKRAKSQTEKIVLKLSDAVERIKFGDGDEEVFYNANMPISIGESQRFIFDVEKYSEEYVEMPFSFAGKIVLVRFNLSAEKTTPIEPTTLIDDVLGHGETYTVNADWSDSDSIVTGGHGPRYLHERMKELVRYEKIFITERAERIHIVPQLGKKVIAKAETLNLPENVRARYVAICDYFLQKDTTPSLHYPTDELCELYTSFLDEFNREIEAIPQGASLNKNVRDWTRLGVVELEDGTLLFSPFHPLLMAYLVEMHNAKLGVGYNKRIVRELSPRYLMPYIVYGNNNYHTVVTPDVEDVQIWIKYVPAESNAMCEVSNFASKLIKGKIKEFLTHFNYYFASKECPIVISSVGMSNSVDLIRGIASYIKEEKDQMQCIEIHEYVDDILEETFFEKLNRNASTEKIVEILSRQNFKLSLDEENDVVRLLFSKVSYYKHDFKQDQELSNYTHLSFYKMETGDNFTQLLTNSLRTEAMLNGLVSTWSTATKEENKYLMGYGTKGMPSPVQQIVYRTASNMNGLYAGLFNGGLSAYSRGQCLAKLYTFNDSKFLDSVYEKSSWVTFLNPNVDINFFYKQENLYVIHYVEQHAISAKLESITVTRQTDQYNELLSNSIEKYKSIVGTNEVFSRKMIGFFNCLNGKWLLDILRKPELVIREKMSLVATCYVMQHFMKRTDNILWIPIALDEHLRVTGSIGATMEGIFSKKDLKINGALSDDILMVGLSRNETGSVNMYYYPVEVKVQKKESLEHGEIQVANLYNKGIKENLLEGDSFTRKVYRALIGSLFLSNAEKMNANGLLSDEDYEKIEGMRFKILNAQINPSCDLPNEIGVAGLVVYSDSTPQSMSLKMVDGVPICNIHMQEFQCYQIVTNPDDRLLSFVEKDVISTEDGEFDAGESVIDDGHDNSTNVNEDLTSQPGPHLSPQTSEEPPYEIVSTEHETQSISEIEPCVRIVLGVNTKASNKSIVFEPNNTDRITHPNMGIIGTMGTGKTQLARSIIAQFAVEGVHNVGGNPIGMLVFDYKGDYNDDAFLKSVGGNCYSYNFPFNPLKLIITEKNHMMNLPSITADRISDSFATAYNLGPVQRNTIKEVIVNTYAKFGITKDPKTWDNPLPTMQDVVNCYFEQYDSRDSVFALFGKINDYSIFAEENDNCVSLFEWLDGVRVVDLTPYPEDTKKVIVALILDLFYEEMRQLGASQLQDAYRELRAMILVDEAHQFLKKDFNSFRNIISEGRSFGVGMILSTQNVSDFKSSKMEYSQFILSWAIHHVNSIQKSEISNIFGSDTTDYRTIANFVSKAEKFHSICKIGNDVYAMRDLPFYEMVKDDNRFKKNAEHNSESGHLTK